MGRLGSDPSGSGPGATRRHAGGARARVRDPAAVAIGIGVYGRYGLYRTAEAIADGVVGAIRWVRGSWAHGRAATGRHGRGIPDR